MASDSVRALHEELPAHGTWVRKLARSLVRDEASADDVAQGAALAALRRQGSIRGALAPWLERVTRNLARRGWRDAARRAARERAVARAEAPPGADEAAARLEIQRLLVEELAALEPAQRRALVRRHFDGWSAARIARESGEPASTVRRFSVFTEIRPGPNRWEDDFAMGRLSGRCLSAQPGDELTLFYNTEQGVEPSCWLLVEPDESGRYVLPFVPAGKGRIRRLEADGETWVDLVETEVLARRERVLDVP